ncbi:uncharacterized protein LOC107360354 [Tetranychus urticae]|uniref:Uncharacterized protein n=1 Tax=Tetranychus urticae TaxID=32264 RepID=T1K4X1_TETUR|nr:uncharacterized protein LOC107360354 [Tetranychus urticae]
MLCMMDGQRLMDSSISIPSAQKPAIISMNPMDTSSSLTDQLFMTSGILVAWTMLIIFGLFITVISILLVYKARQRKSSSLNPLEGIGTSKSANYNGQESGYSDELTPPNSSSVNIGNFVPITRRIKVSSSYASLTSDSSSEEEFPEGRRKSQISMTHELTVGPKGTVRAFPVQPLSRETSVKGHHQRNSMNHKLPGNSVATVSTVNNSGNEKKPQLTISMSLDSETNLVKVTLVKCEHLKRSIEPKESTFRRVVRARGLSSGYLPLGVLARVYRLSDVRDVFLLSRQSSTLSSTGPGRTSRSTSTESEPGTLPNPGKSPAPLMETPLIKSRKGSFVKFNEESDSIEISVDDFPLRVSLYEMDKNKVKSPLGHSIIDYLTSLNVSTLNQIVLNVRLYETVFEAMKANQEQNKG